MEGTGSYLAVGALAAAAGSYAYTYNQVQNLQKEISKVSDSITKTNDSLKVYDENVKDSIKKLMEWANLADADLNDMKRKISNIEQFLVYNLRYEVQEQEPAHEPPQQPRR